MKVTIVQSEIKWHDPSENFKRVATLIDSISDADLIVLPEMWFSGFTMKAAAMAKYTDEGINKMQQWAESKEAAVCGSMITQHSETDYRNRFYFVDKEGVQYTYDKKHLFSYAGEDRHFSAGDSRLDIQFGQFKLRANICYDLRFPVWARNDTAYDVLLYTANWPDKRISAWQTLLKARAIENQCYVIGCNCAGKDAWGNTYEGHSLIIDPAGAVLGTCKGSGIVSAELDKSTLDKFRKDLPFLKDADSFTIK